jgi:hypothetical protein
MTFPCPAASRQKVPLVATLLAGFALLIAHPVKAADGQRVSSNWAKDAAAVGGWQYRSSAVTDTADDASRPAHSWLSGQDVHFTVDRGPSYPSNYGGATRDEAVRMSLTLKWW